MNLLKNIKNIIWVLAISLPILLMFSCVNEDLSSSSQEYYNPAEDSNMVCLPLSIAFGGSNSTRVGEDGGESGSSGNPTDTDPGFTDGSAKEHQIDFDTHTNNLHESFAIIFQEKKVKYIQPLYLSEQLGSGAKPDNEPNVEYAVPVVTYINKEDVILPEVGEEDTGIYETTLTSILVVLNGGKIYKKIADKVEELKNKHTEDDIAEILKLKWENPANYKDRDRNNWNQTGVEGIIGFNEAGLFTMTNSIYYEPDNDDTSKIKLVNATPITGKAYTSVRKYVETQNAEPSATIYVERVVAKFSAPTFDTEVIGSNRVFRPDQNALPMVVYSWDGDIPVPTQKNWRIHLLGWAINGDESETYIFKKIPEGISLSNWDFSSWNDAINHRSYWSIDPHYSSTQYSDGSYDFYPWQYRKAADREDIISMQAGLNLGTIGDENNNTSNQRVPVLRYNSFNDVLNSWAWRNELHVHENTFDPNGDWYTINHTDTYLDDRASVLAGPHLLIAGELYLEQPGGSYLGQFGTVENIYSDRIRRYYMTEADFFKMFVHDFNRALVAQEKMSFDVYDWDENSSGKSNYRYQAFPSGACRLFLRQKIEDDRVFDPNAITIEGLTPKYANGSIDERDKNYKFTEVTMAMVDALFERGYSLSALANVRNGDGRLIPWIEGDNAEKDIDENWKDFGLVVRAPDGSRLKFNTNENTGDPVYDEDHTDWSYDMYKSLFYEWFGPIDHYYKGYMYYAGDIRHKNVNVQNSHNYYGTVRNHWYKFRVEAINSLGIPVDDPDQLIIPGKYNYRDQIIVYLDILGWHSRETIIDIQ